MVAWAPLLPGYSWHPTRSYLMRVERGNPVRSITFCCGGRPTVREAESRGGNRTPKKRMPAAERQQESGTISRRSFQPDGFSYNWPDTGPGARLRKQADVWRVSL